METLIPALIFVLGLIIGSFLNVCIYRLPLEKSMVTPRSFCPNCKKTIPWHDNIPLISYVLLGGRCRFCKTKIPFNYFFVELMTGLMFLALYNRFYLSIEYATYVVFACGLIVITFVDFKHQIIPDEISVPGIILGFVLSIAFPVLHKTNSRMYSMIDSGLGILAGGGFLYLMGVLGEKMFKKEAMGFGDVKLLAMIGAFLGWKLVLITVFLSSVFGLFIGIILKAVKKAEYIAYGPYLALAAVMSVFWGEKIIELYIKLIARGG